MPRDYEEMYGLFVRQCYDMIDDPESCEEPVMTCPSYGEAKKVKDLLFKNTPDCVIRFLGNTGGGD